MRPTRQCPPPPPLASRPPATSACARAPGRAALSPRRFSNQFTYKDIENDFCSDLLPHMLSLGYELATVTMIPNGTLRRGVSPVRFDGNAGGKHYCAHEERWTRTGRARRATVYNEGDAFFRRQNATLPPPPGWVPA